MAAADGGIAVPVVDFPGHVKLRTGVTKYLDRARKVVFVTDALEYNKIDRVQDAAGCVRARFADVLCERGCVRGMTC